MAGYYAFFVFVDYQRLSFLNTIKYVVVGHIVNISSCVEWLDNPIDNHHYKKNYLPHPNEIDTTDWCA